MGIVSNTTAPRANGGRGGLQILALTIDDANGFIVGAGFIEAETTFAHFAHVRKIFLTPGETKQVTIVQQLGSFRVIARPPTPQEPQWANILAEYRP